MIPTHFSAQRCGSGAAPVRPRGRAAVATIRFPFPPYAYPTLSLLISNKRVNTSNLPKGVGEG